VFPGPMRGEWHILASSTTRRPARAASRGCQIRTSAMIGTIVSLSDGQGWLVRDLQVMKALNNDQIYCTMLDLADETPAHCSAILGLSSNNFLSSKQRCVMDDQSEITPQDAHNDAKKTIRPLPKPREFHVKRGRPSSRAISFVICMPTP
jgi:hypothetical protein